jgi:UDP-N-acetylmuramyl pentapeptide phosphotransferase/UDP-N-acetylglucosamine-1-phosphate transferase
MPLKLFNSLNWITFAAMLYLLYLPFLFLVMLAYFKVAIRYNIIDHPNHRSSHNEWTIRGGGILFPIALLLEFFISGFAYPLFISGLMLISLVSFYDDVRPLTNKIRLLTHLTAVSLLFIQAGLMDYSIWLIAAAYIVAIGSINAYNFMDGINGITACYSLVSIATLFLINEYITPFLPFPWFLPSIMSLIVFGFFNFRKKAKCFAGDVGSIGMAYILTFFFTLLILRTGEIKYFGLFLVYGLDSITTILFRLIRGENIFEAHRTHFYQFLVNTKSWPHLAVSSFYAFLQLIMNVFIVKSDLDGVPFMLFLFASGVLVFGLRLVVEGRHHLLRTKAPL